MSEFGVSVSSEKLLNLALASDTEVDPLPLPVYAYSDPAIYDQEMRRIFHPTAQYLGHALSVPQVGDFHALPQENEGRVLVRTPLGISVLSNVCRHRQAIMLKGRGNTGRLLNQPAGQAPIVCPLHRWTYNDQGRLMGAPHFDKNPCLHLQQYTADQWNGLLFEDPSHQIATRLEAIEQATDFDFSGYAFGGMQIHECGYNWKTFIEVYLEDYHVAPFHPGLGHFVTCDDLVWTFHSDCSVQTVGVSRSFDQPGSPVYEKWHEMLLRYRQGQKPDRGAVWLTAYPTLMLEWYPHVLVVSSLFPQGPSKTINLVEFFYPEDIVAFEPEFIQAQQAAYMETCIEDDDIALRMDAGRRALMDRGLNQVGPYQYPMEEGMKHFHQWYRSKMQDASGTR
jgi:choline monooxygenase